VAPFLKKGRSLSPKKGRDRISIRKNGAKSRNLYRKKKERGHNLCRGHAREQSSDAAVIIEKGISVQSTGEKKKITAAAADLGEDAPAFAIAEDRFPSVERGKLNCLLGGKKARLTPNSADLSSPTNLGKKYSRSPRGINASKKSPPSPELLGRDETLAPARRYG